MAHTPQYLKLILKMSDVEKSASARTQIYSDLRKKELLIPLDNIKECYEEGYTVDIKGLDRNLTDYIQDYIAGSYDEEDITNAIVNITNRKDLIKIAEKVLDNKVKNYDYGFNEIKIFTNRYDNEFSIEAKLDIDVYKELMDIYKGFGGGGNGATSPKKDENDSKDDHTDPQLEKEE